ncbi:hypothetical protein D3OALGB2SA_3968 [Olavius algarvensis associated proteobacterium Delta 3]|nr:hypothetical protein D3OALGB2SA_3968 [Olavius algarvensis associated proteobacterium Delta 3]
MISANLNEHQKKIHTLCVLRVLPVLGKRSASKEAQSKGVSQAGGW